MMNNKELKSYFLISVFAAVVLSLAFSFLNIDGNVDGRAYYYNTVQVYGEVIPNFQDGTNIAFKVDGVVIASAQLKDGKYGYETKVVFKNEEAGNMVKDGYSEGDTVSVYIEDVKVAEISYFDGVNEKNIEVPISLRAEVTERAAEVSLCKSTWECGSWSPCVDSVQKRECSDISDCRLESGKPTIERKCLMPQEEPREEFPVSDVPERKGIGSLFGTIILIFTISVAFIVVQHKRKAPKKKR